MTNTKAALESLHGIVLQEKDRERAIRAVPVCADAYGLRYGTTERAEYAEQAGIIVRRYFPDCG
jgi:hypothetical protein